MKNKKIVVLLKYYKGELNPFDGAALECALETGASEIIALTMSPPSALNAFQGRDLRDPHLYEKQFVVTMGMVKRQLREIIRKTARIQLNADVFDFDVDDVSPKAGIAVAGNCLHTMSALLLLRLCVIFLYYTRYFSI